MPDFLSTEILTALFQVIMIDLVLAGDNALIIGLVARNLPKDRQRKVIFWGTFGAIATRAVMAIVVVWILNLPGFMLAGGVALVWIARKLLTPDPDAAANHAAKAPAKLVAGPLTRWFSAPCSSGVSSLRAIHTKARPPASMKPGTSRI